MDYGKNEDYKFVSGDDLCMIIDGVTGKRVRWDQNRRAVGKVKDALKYVKGDIGNEKRNVIVKLDCIIGVKIENASEK